MLLSSKLSSRDAITAENQNIFALGSLLYLSFFHYYTYIYFYTLQILQTANMLTQ